MAYPVTASTITLSDLQGHSPVASLFKWDFFMQLCSRWQNFNWHSASLGLLR